MRSLWIFMFTFLLELAGFKVQGEFIRACYFTSWSRYKVSPLAKYDVTDINANICSHLLYAFANIDAPNLNIAAADPNNEEGAGGKFRQFTNLKLQSPQLKTLLSVGGEHARSSEFRQIITTDSIRTQFAANVAVYLLQFGFDGLDLDWEYPEAQDKENYALLLKTLRVEFDKASPRLLLTGATSAYAPKVDAGYDLTAMADAMDYVFIMTYDYHGLGWSKVASFSAPLYSRPTFSELLSVNYTVHYYNSHGLPYNKMVIGLTGASHHFKLKDASVSSVGSPVQLTNTETGPLFKIPGRIVYTELCKMMEDKSATVSFDQIQKQNIYVNGLSWIGFENPYTARIKVKFAESLGMPGIMFWSLDYDDFTGQGCKRGKYPILSAVNDEAGVITSTTTQQPGATIGQPEVIETSPPQIVAVTSKPVTSRPVTPTSTQSAQRRKSTVRVLTDGFNTATSYTPQLWLVSLSLSLLSTVCPETNWTPCYVTSY